MPLTTSNVWPAFRPLTERLILPNFENSRAAHQGDHPSVASYDGYESAASVVDDGEGQSYLSAV